jgi:hypothetical protein
MTHSKHICEIPQRETFVEQRLQTMNRFKTGLKLVLHYLELANRLMNDSHRFTDEQTR